MTRKQPTEPYRIGKGCKTYPILEWEQASKIIEEKFGRDARIKLEVIAWSLAENDFVAAFCALAEIVGEHG